MARTNGAGIQATEKAEAEIIETQDYLLPQSKTVPHKKETEGWRDNSAIDTELVQGPGFNPKY